MAVMNRGNAKLNRFALEVLAVSPGDCVLEIGFGGGLLLPALLSRAERVIGIDRSEAALMAAEARFHRAMGEGRVEFREGSVEALPLAEASVDKAVTVNTIYFWSSLAAGMAEIKRGLKPGGRVVIGFLAKDRMDRMNLPSDIFTSRAPEDVVSALSAAGFRDARIMRPKPSTPWAVATATA